MAQRGPERAVARRDVLAAGTALTVWGLTVSAGCSVGGPANPPTPVETSGSSGSKGPSAPATDTAPTASAGSGSGPHSEAHAREQRLLSSATVVLTAANGPGRGSARGRVLTQIRQGHLAHVAALASASPTSRPMPSGSPTPTAATGSVRVATRLALLRADELAAATAYLDRARTSSGVESLFWASLGSAATAYAEALTAAPGFPTERALGTSPVEPAVLVPPGEVAAMQTLITQLHGVIYGYQLCIGRLDGTRRAEAELRLRHHRALGDRLADALVARSATVPAAAPAYVPPIRPTNAARATALVRRMEVGLQPWAGRWVAASADDPTRRVAVAALASGTRTAARWGSPLPVWPGWSD